MASFSARSASRVSPPIRYIPAATTKQQSPHRSACFWSQRYIIQSTSSVRLRKADLVRRQKCCSERRPFEVRLQVRDWSFRSRSTSSIRVRRASRASRRVSTICSNAGAEGSSLSSGSPGTKCPHALSSSYAGGEGSVAVARLVLG